MTNLTSLFLTVLLVEIILSIQITFKRLQIALSTQQNQNMRKKYYAGFAFHLKEFHNLIFVKLVLRSIKKSI